MKINRVGLRSLSYSKHYHLMRYTILTIVLLLPISGCNSFDAERFKKKFKLSEKKQVDAVREAVEKDYVVYGSNSYQVEATEIMHNLGYEYRDEYVWVSTITRKKGTKNVGGCVSVISKNEGEEYRWERPMNGPCDVEFNKGAFYKQSTEVSRKAIETFANYVNNEITSSDIRNLK
jgi:hypothetical protein